MITIPKGNPIKIWLDGELSWNSTNPKNFNRTPFFHKWKLSNTVRLQVYTPDDISANLKAVIYSGGVIVETLDFVNTDGRHDLSFLLSDIFNDIALFDIQIVKTFQLLNQEFSNNSAWESYDLGSDVTISGGSSNSFINFGQSPYKTKVMRQNFTLPVNEYTFEYKLTIDPHISVMARARLKILFYDSEDNVLLTLNATEHNGEGVYESSVTTLSSPAGTTKIGYRVDSQSPDEFTFSIDYLRMISSTVLEGYTDCLQICEEDEDIITLKYSSPHNYIGLNFEGNLFELPVEGTFAIKNTASETESGDFADNNTELLSSSSKDQTLLEVDSCPDYIFSLIKRVIKSNTLKVLDENYVAEEDLPMDRIGKSLQYKGSVWLTNKNSIDYITYGNSI